MPPQVGGEMSLFDLGRYAGKAEKKAAEMGRFFASEWLREPGAQRFLINKVTPFLKSGIDQISTAIRPKKIIKQIEKILMAGELISLILCMDQITHHGLEKESIFTKPLENFQNQNQVSLFRGINILVRIIH